MSNVEPASDTFIEDGITYHPKSQFHYENATFEAGFVEGHEHDTMYLKIDKPHKDGEAGLYYRVLMMPSEASALIWTLTSVMAYLGDEKLIPNIEAHNKQKFRLLRYFDKRKRKEVTNDNL